MSVYEPPKANTLEKLPLKLKLIEIDAVDGEFECGSAFEVKLEFDVEEVEELSFTSEFDVEDAEELSSTFEDDVGESADGGDCEGGISDCDDDEDEVGGGWLGGELGGEWLGGELGGD